jgi:hypothetical protein
MNGSEDEIGAVTHKHPVGVKSLSSHALSLVRPKPVSSSHLLFFLFFETEK